MRGRRKWMRITAKVECADGRAVRIFGIKQDVTEERVLLDRTRYLAEYDTLTGLANRGQFQARLSEIDLVQSEVVPYSALVLIDIDHFKAINDTFGHSVGDQCLIETARRLKLFCGPAHHIARIGGDEFAILLQPDLSPRDLDDFGARLLSAFADTGPVPGTAVRLGTSIGIAEAGDISSRQLFLNADTALYAAKDAGRGSVRRYLPDMGSRHDQRLAIETVETLRARPQRINRTHADVA
jgi:diguanylate cyclase (GGDEF)-like protein